MNTRQIFAAVIALGFLCEPVVYPDDLSVRMILENARQRAQAVAKDREALNEQSVISRERLKQIREVEGWAAQGFDDPLSQDGTRYANRSVKVARVHELRAQVVSHLVNLPTDESKGRIWSGTGLNALQECLSVAALQHERHLRNAALTPEAERTSAQQERLVLLQSIAADVLIPRQLLARIDCVREGDLGKPLPLQLDFTKSGELKVLPLDWPIFLKQQPELRETLERIEKAKAECQSAQNGDYEPLEELKYAIDDLTKKLVKIRNHHFTSQPARTTPEENRTISERSTQILKSLNFVKTLRLGVVKFVEVKESPEVSGYVVDGFQPGIPENQVSLITVLAYMEERGLRFADAKSDPLGSRLTIFKQMRNYYGSMYGLSIAVNEQEKEVGRIDNLIAESHKAEEAAMMFDLRLLELTRPPDINIIATPPSTTTTTTTTTK